MDIKKRPNYKIYLQVLRQMSQQELLKKVIQVLNQAGIQYMITGSVVSSLQGEPRSTHDIDYLKQWVKKLWRNPSANITREFTPLMIEKEIFQKNYQKINQENNSPQEELSGKTAWQIILEEQEKLNSKKESRNIGRKS